MRRLLLAVAFLGFSGIAQAQVAPEQICFGTLGEMIQAQANGCGSWVDPEDILATTVHADTYPEITGNIIIQAGAGIVITQTGNTIIISLADVDPGGGFSAPLFILGLGG